METVAPKMGEFSSQTKLDLLELTGTKPITNRGMENSLCSCCGSRGKFMVVPNREYAYINHEFTRPEKPIPQQTREHYLLIPDAAGNLVIEWGDRK